MAQEAPGIQNKTVLIVAIVLGLLVAGIYEYQVSSIRNADKKNQVFLLQFRHDVKPGARIERKHFDFRPVPRSIAEGLGVVTLNDPEDINRYRDEPLTRGGKVNQFLRFDHLKRSSSLSPSVRIEEGNVAVPLMLDPRLSPGEILRPGDHVNVIAEFDFTGQGRREYYVIKGVRVHTVGGKGLEEDEDTGRVNDRGVRTFRGLTVEVRQDVSLTLRRLMGEKTVSVEVCSSSPDAQLPSDAGEINPEVERLARKAGIIP